MTRFIYDQFSKDYLEELLKPYGEVNSSKKVAAEVKEIDVWFTPSPTPSRKRELLGILGRMAETSSIFEPYRNAVTSDEIWDCLLKLGEISKALQREANRNKN